MSDNKLTDLPDNQQVDYLYGVSGGNSKKTRPYDVLTAGGDASVTRPDVTYLYGVYGGMSKRITPVDIVLQALQNPGEQATAMADAINALLNP